ATTLRPASVRRSAIRPRPWWKRVRLPATSFPRRKAMVRTRGRRRSRRFADRAGPSPARPIADLRRPGRPHRQVETLAIGTQLADLHGLEVAADQEGALALFRDGPAHLAGQFVQVLLEILGQRIGNQRAE